MKTVAYSYGFFLFSMRKDLCGFCKPTLSIKQGVDFSIEVRYKEKAWFMDYATKWIWYNSDDGEDEDDFTVEDVLYHYTKRLSVA